MRALVVLNGDQGGTDRWLASLATTSDVVIAADGGALRLRGAGARIDLVIGDLDSIADDARRALERDGVTIDVHPKEKDQTDAELAIDAAIERGADEIVIAGAFGGDRVDHGIANLLLLAHDDIAAIDVALVTERATIRSVLGPAVLEVEGEPGDYVTLEALSERARGVSTDGLRYPLRHEELARGSTRGVSNELTERRGSVEISEGLLLVAVTRRRSVPSR